MPEDEHQPSLRSNSAMDGLRRAIQVESAAIRAYKRFLGLSGNPTPDPSVMTIVMSHHNRHAILEGYMFSYQPDLQKNWTYAPTGPFSDLLRSWNTAQDSLQALSECERRTLAWYHDESKRHEAFIVDVIANQLMPEQTRTTTLIGGLVRRGQAT